MRGTLVTRTWQYDPTLYAPPRYRKACRYEAFVPDPLAGGQFNLPSRVFGIVSDAEQAIMGLNAIARPALEPLARLLLRTESVASSKVEGLQVGIRQLVRAESRIETGGSASPMVREVIGNIDAMKLAVEQAATAASIDLTHLTAIHARLMAKSPTGQVAGRLRKGQNWIGGNDYNPCGADFVPPPPDHVERLLFDLCVAMAEESLPPLVQAAMVHAQFETIHPFDDGNGRTGRALIHVVLRRRGLAASYVPPLSVVLASDRERYIEGLTHFRDGNVESWIERFAIAAARAARLAQAHLGAVTALMERWRRLLAAGDAPRADAAAWVVIGVLPAHPVITAPVAAAATGRAKAAIHLAIQQLEHCGVLVPVSTSKRNRSWEATGLVELLEGLEAGRLPGD
ncbi:MAG: Fic family protein [Armatimonadetes bacterium]|nr:Fic family protein [Armatimonadota bacterium]